jgi:excisionase family DNA binding protein
MSNDAERRTYTVEEVARLVGVSRGVAYEAVRTGEIRSLTIGRRIVIPPSVVANCSAANRRLQPSLPAPVAPTTHSPGDLVTKSA